jgi:DNA-binding LytR/AlgR family response regulator
MTTALIADDEPHLALYLREQLLLLWPGLEIVHVAPNGVDAAAAIARLQPDVAFLDIQMPGLTGLEVAQGIEGQTRVVFVTAYDEYALRAFDEAALDYLLKPLRQERLIRSVRRIQAALAPQPAPPGADLPDARLAEALRRLLSPPSVAGAAAGAAAGAVSRAPLRYVRAAQGAVTQQIAVEDVLFFQSDDKYTAVRTATGEYLIRTSIAELAGQLDPAHFCQVHRATLVNLAHLDSARRDETSRLFLRMRGHEAELPVSRAYVHHFKAM